MTFFYLYFQSLHIKQHLINSVEASFLRTLTNSDINLGINYNKKKIFDQNKNLQKNLRLKRILYFRNIFLPNFFKGGGRGLSLKNKIKLCMSSSETLTILHIF